jgi:predicted ATPase/class 3 adenylate cyclase
MPPDQGAPLENLKKLLSGVDPEQLRQVMPLVGGGVITMMFTDIVDSTRVKREVGDLVYFAALKQHNSAIRDCIARHAGHELKTIGDSFFIAFRNPTEAVQCAGRIQQTLTETPIAVGDGSINVRIGLHTGTPIVYRDNVSGRSDLSGTDVDKAARVEGIARGGQVLISEQTRVLVDSVAVHDWGSWELKGLGGQRIFELLYRRKQPEVPAGHMRLEPLRFATSFVGREREVAELIELVKKHRLVTVTGIGGIGKTRLTDLAARRVSGTFADGAFFVELAEAANSEGAVISTLVAALTVNPAGFKDETEALLRTLENGQMLIVLDNFEGVLSAAPLVGKLFLGCPHAHFLVTSQMPLNIEGEQLYRAPPMGVPTAAADANALAEHEAFALFRDRARTRVHDWDTRSPADAAAVADVLRLVDGIPLAIELAAAWVGSKTLAEIMAGLGNRLNLLKRRGVGMTSRHQSMRACLDYSFDLLSEDAKELLPKLSVFAGGFFLEDVEAVCGEPKAGELLLSLHERNLLARQEALDRSRYTMLGTVQEYAAEKLPDTAARELGRAHARHFLEILCAADQQLGGAGYVQALERVGVDFANFEVGIGQSQATGDHDAVVGYAASVEGYLRIQGRHNDRLSLALMARAAAGNLGAEAVAGADNNLGKAYWELPTGDRGDNLQRAIACYEAALRVWTEREFPDDWALTQNNLGIAYGSPPIGERGENLRRAIACYEAALRVWTEREFPRRWAAVQNNLGNAYGDLKTGDRGENLRRAMTCYEAALRVWTEREFPYDWAVTQNNLGITCGSLPIGERGENLRCAITCYEAALRVRTERDFPHDWATTQTNLGIAYGSLPTGERGDNLQRAVAYYEAALRVWTERDSPRDWAIAQTNLGIAYRNLPTGDRGDNLRRAIACYEAALRVGTERYFPQDWAMNQTNLGNAYRDLPTGDRGDNLQRAIGCYEAAARGYDGVGMTSESDRARAAAQELQEQLEKH